MTEHKRKHAPYIHLSTALSIAGNELVEMAGAITEREYANENKLDRASKAAHKALAAVDEYYKATDAENLYPPRFVPGSNGPHPRPGYYTPATGKRPDESADDFRNRTISEGLRADTVMQLDALNGDPDEAA